MRADNWSDGRWGPYLPVTDLVTVKSFAHFVTCAQTGSIVLTFHKADPTWEQDLDAVINVHCALTPSGDIERIDLCVARPDKLCDPHPTVQLE